MKFLSNDKKDLFKTFVNISYKIIWDHRKPFTTSDKKMHNTCGKWRWRFSFILLSFLSNRLHRCSTADWMSEQLNNSTTLMMIDFNSSWSQCCHWTQVTEVDPKPHLLQHPKSEGLGTISPKKISTTFILFVFFLNYLSLSVILDIIFSKCVCFFDKNCVIPEL